MTNNAGLTKQMLEAAKDYRCENCSHMYFVPVFAIKTISPIVSPNGKELNIPVQTFACAKCNNVNKEFVPKVGNELFNS